MAGLVGAGRSEVAEAVFGAVPLNAGEVQVRGERLPSGSIDGALTAPSVSCPKIASTSGPRSSHDRVGQSFDGGAPEDDTAGLLTSRKEVHSRRNDRRLPHEDPQTHMPPQALSGGNQQKLVIGGGGPRPTHGC